MRFRTGLLIGLGVGYYYGAKAGRERYEQIEVWLEKVRNTTTYQDVRIKVSDGWRESTIVARRALEDSGGYDTHASDHDTNDNRSTLRSIFSDPTLN